MQQCDRPAHACVRRSTVVIWSEFFSFVHLCYVCMYVCEHTWMCTSQYRCYLEFMTFIMGFCSCVYAVRMPVCMYVNIWVGMMELTKTYCDLQNNWNISTAFNGFWYQFTTEPRRSVFQLFCKSQYDWHLDIVLALESKTLFKSDCPRVYICIRACKDFSKQAFFNPNTAKAPRQFSRHVWHTL